MILADYQIKHRVISKQLGIEPFVPRKENHERTAISYGLSSFGYDLRLSPNEFLIFRHIPGEILNPKSFNPDFLEPTPLVETPYGSAFVLPGHSYGLGVSLERLRIPRDCITICLGKSSYARCGLIVNVTPFEPDWEGYPTLEITNCSSADAYVFANEGICQIIFLNGYTPEQGYGNGKYQYQDERVVTSKC